MLRRICLSVGSVLLLVCVIAAPRRQPLAGTPVVEAESAYTPTYTKEGRLLFPATYREWVYLSSGVDMSYNPKVEAMGHSAFDNVFVNPEAYARFKETGTWPDKTVLVLEARMGMDKGSINQKGHFQGTEVMGLEVHVKDKARFAGDWAFFDFEDQVSGSLFKKDADCYSCHAQHAAVDTTFVQFYPTLLPIAKQKQTLSASYLKEVAAEK